MELLSLLSLGTLQQLRSTHGGGQPIHPTPEVLLEHHNDIAALRTTRHSPPLALKAGFPQPTAADPLPGSQRTRKLPTLASRPPQAPPLHTHPPHPCTTPAAPSSASSPMNPLFLR